MTPVTLEGQTLGKYRILEALGRGGMAQVYRAYHSQLDRYVAIKVLRSDLVEEEEFLARFRREAQAVAALRHPNIVQVYDFDIQGEQYYMVMELLEGDTLKARLNTYRSQAQRMPWREMFGILNDVLEGLSYAHTEGIIHRDIKPANILLSKRGQAVVTDFGIAQIIGGTRYTMSGALMGTLHYMAPEQGMQGHGDARSDLYSLGIVFYEMLTGKPPFDADTPLAILMKHVNDPLPLPRQLDTTIPESLERIVLKALSKQPEDRYQTAAEMAQALREAAASMAEQAEAPRMRLADLPAASGSVFSGASRQQIGASGLNSGDTDPALGQRLQSEAAPQDLGKAIESSVQQLIGLVSSAVGTAVAAANKEIESARQEVEREGQSGESRRSGVVRVKLSPDAPPVMGEDDDVDDDEDATPDSDAPVVRQSQVAMAPIVTGILMLAVIFLLSIFDTVLGWGMWERGWPVLLLLAGLMLSWMGSALANPGLIIPAGITTGVAALLAFFSVTDLWGFWPPWLLLPVMVFIAISLTTVLTRSGNKGRRAARAFLVLLAVVNIFLIPMVLVGALLGSVISR